MQVLAVIAVAVALVGFILIDYISGREVVYLEEAQPALVRLTGRKLMNWSLRKKYKCRNRASNNKDLSGRRKTTDHSWFVETAGRPDIIKGRI